MKEVCRICGINFNQYIYYEDCSSCNDGEDNEGGYCNNCEGTGVLEESVINYCKPCLTDYLEQDF